MSDSNRIDQLERDLSFLARHIRLVEVGHATTEEYVRAQEIIDRHPRFGD